MPKIFINIKLKQMKKLALSIAALALVATTMTSCKKDYTCECTVSGSGVTGGGTTTIKDTKKNAEEACEKLSSTAFGITTTCKIK